jgi:hypothetical protein
LKNSITKTPLKHNNGKNFAESLKNGSQAANQMFSAFPEITLAAYHES